MIVRSHKIQSDRHMLLMLRVLSTSAALQHITGVLISHTEELKAPALSSRLGSLSLESVAKVAVLLKVHAVV